MPFCVEAPVIKDRPECCVFDICFDCGLTMPSNPSTTKDFTWSGYFVIFILIMVGFWNLASFYRVYKDNNNYISIMRIGNTLYAFGTAVFGFCRIHYQLGKPLLIFAAIHNLPEWVFVAFAFYQNRKIREYAIFGSICFVSFIIGLVMVILTEFPYFALAEQTTGISLDFMLPFIWFILWLQNRDIDTAKTKRGRSSKKKAATITSGSSSTIEPAIYSIGNIYFIAFIAHSVHILFTILPLVVVNFIRDQNETLSRVIEFMIFLSVPITHILYTKFTNLHEQNIDLPSVLNADAKGPIDYPDKYVVQTSPFVCCGNNTSSFTKMILWYTLCIIIGFFPTIVIPAMLPKCAKKSAVITGAAGSESPAGSGPNDNIFIGTSTAIVFEGMDESFKDYILSKNLIENARNHDGNVFYYFNKDIQNPNKYFFVEGWESMEAVQQWIKTEFVGAAFNNYTYQMLENGALEMNAYSPLYRSEEQNDNQAPGAIKYTFQGFNGCSDIGEDMIDFMNCEWILGCDRVKITDQDKGERQLILKNGKILNNKVTYKNKEITGQQTNYTLMHYISELDRSYYIELISDPIKYGYGQCRGLFKFDANINIETIDSIYNGFMNDNIVYLQRRYESAPDSSVCAKTADGNDGQASCYQ